MMSLAQVRLLESQIKKNESETTGQDILNRYTPQQFEQQLQKGQVDIDYTKSLIDKAATEIAEGNSRIEVNKEQAKLLTSQFSETQLRALSHIYDIDYTKANTDLVRQKITSEMLEQSLYSYRKALMSAQTRETDARTANINSETFRNEWRNDFIRTSHVDPDANQWQLITQMTKGIVFDAAPQIGAGIKKLWTGYDRLVGKGVNFVRNKTSSNNRRRSKEMQEPTNQD